MHICFAKFEVKLCVHIVSNSWVNSIQMCIINFIWTFPGIIKFHFSFASGIQIGWLDRNYCYKIEPFGSHIDRTLWQPSRLVEVVAAAAEAIAFGLLFRQTSMTYTYCVTQFVRILDSFFSHSMVHMSIESVRWIKITFTARLHFGLNEEREQKKTHESIVVSIGLITK